MKKIISLFIIFIFVFSLVPCAFAMETKAVDINSFDEFSIEQVQIQAEEYGHSFERELSYMVVHSFYHLLGYDHIKEEDKKIMRPKEEYVLSELGITRE